MTINELVADGKDFDGVYFCKSNENGTEGWSLTFLNLERKQDRKFEEHEIHPHPIGSFQHRSNSL